MLLTKNYYLIRALAIENIAKKPSGSIEINEYNWGKKISKHIDKIYKTRKIILRSWEKMKGINKVLRMVKNEYNRIVYKKPTEKW